jgi:cytochrome c oxidase assembly protein subunit 15
VSQLHTDAVFLFLGLTVGLFFTVRATHGVTRPLQTLLVVIGVQAVIGFAQYATDLPILLVGLHMLGAALVSAAVTWVLITVREPAAAPGAVT